MSTSTVYDVLYSFIYCNTDFLFRFELLREFSPLHYVYLFIILSFSLDSLPFIYVALYL